MTRTTRATRAWATAISQDGSTVMVEEGAKPPSRSSQSLRKNRPWLGTALAQSASPSPLVFSPRGPGVPLLARASPAPPVRGGGREGAIAPLTLISALELGASRLDPGQPLPDRIEAARVGEPEVTVRAEVGSGHHGDTRDIEQEARDAGGALERPALPAAAEQARDIRERVEGALRHPAADPRDPVQTRDDLASAAFKLPDHLGDLVLRPGQRLRRRPLGDRRGIRGALALEVGDGPDDLPGPGGVPDAPARHGVGLGARLHDQGAGLDLRPERRDAGDAPLVRERFVALVRDHPQATLQDQRSHGLEIWAREHGTRRIVGAVQDQEFR